MTVETSQGCCTVDFGSASAFVDRLADTDRVMIDSNVAALWPRLSLDPARTFVVPAGESSKSLSMFGECLSWMARSGASRNSRLYAVGGGVVGDLAGFVAAAYMRGIELVMVPTSLLAMVDSSVGGKVAIDIPEGKNLVGAFWQPSQVHIGVEFLTTLPAREVLCGAAEIWKYGYIMDREFLERLESKPVSIDGEVEAIVSHCIGLKARVVQGDEHERTGLRAILNFGHTVGHAIEAAAGYQGWTHGEAISIGMAVEARLGEALGTTPPGLADRVVAGLTSQGLPTQLPSAFDAGTIVSFARRDKKSGTDGLGFSLLTGVGECKLVTGVPEHALRAVLAET